MEDLGFEDRRVFLRFAVNLPLEYVILNLRRKGQAQAQNISAGGMGLVMNQRLALHTPLDIWLNVPDQGEPLYTKAEVVWIRKIGFKKYTAGIELQKADLMGISRVMHVNRTEQTIPAEKCQKIKKPSLWQFLNILRIIKLRKP